MSHSMSSPRNIQLVFETYQKARLVFVQTMAELATRATNVKCLESAGVLELLRPLLSDACSSVRQCAVVAAARLCEHDEGVARQLLNEGMVTITLENLHKYNVYYKRSALYLIRAVAKHNEELAGVIVRLGALEHIVSCLEDFDTQVKENAAWALGYIGKHSESLAGLVVDAGTLPLLVLAFQEPEMSLKQISAGALVDLAQHKPEAVVDAGSICHLVRGLENQDPKLKRSTLCALGAVAGARLELAEAVVAGGALPPALLHTGHDAAPVRRAAACLLRDIVKHSVDVRYFIIISSMLAQLVVNTGGSRPLVELLSETAGGVRVPSCMALGFIAGQSDQLAMAVIEAKILPNDARARRLFVTTGALKRVQEIDTVPGTSLKEYINIINSCFPEEIVRYYTPGYSDSLLDRVEAYTPQIPELFTDRVPSDCQSELTIENGN
ncbi:sperm-associated antigen 6-like isoform X5 [Galleria mellonella]|uniref:Sperm-associated antigen 6-like isoform X5 n=1 Tax=Galleria mellonella TaxID=7137 RepID=A0A6J3CBS3_GALME|nr:sperm-associated antigen 6-like isoform X5 [Galleria mellonella]